LNYEHNAICKNLKVDHVNESSLTPLLGWARGSSWEHWCQVGKASCCKDQWLGWRWYYYFCCSCSRFDRWRCEGM